MDSQTRKTKPKYEIIKEALLARIHAGDFSFDESFCTEKMLSVLGKLELQYNRARQGSITQELTEIIAGANAIN